MTKPSVYARYSRGDRTAKEAAEIKGKSERTARRWTSMPRDEWRAQQAAEREAIRAYHDDEGHSWSQTAEHFKRNVSTCTQRARRARREREAEERAKTEPPLPLDELTA